ncbi:MAG: hypothetical protein IE885_06630 [Campylobacterales bacterium]|nr:hypothetical protein [Campylobacterales bacterium]
MKHIITYETLIHCNVENLFEFHADTANLPLITPPDIDVDIIKISTPLKEGNEAQLKIKKWPFSFEWELLFEHVVYPELIVDVALRSPFKTFRHEHHFIEVDESYTLLKDVVTFSLPFGWFTLPFTWLIKRDMNKMFSYRHAKTKEFIARSRDSIQR